MENSSKKAIAYSLLAHIRNSGTLSKGPLDIFIPIVKKALHFMNTNKDQYKGESIKEIYNIIFETYNIDIPIPVLRNVLLLVSQEANQGDEKNFLLNNDNSFWIKDFIFEDYDQKIHEYEIEVAKLQKLFGEFCNANGINNIENNCIIKFIEKNKYSISKYLANSTIDNNNDYIIEAKFIEYFRHNSSVFSLIKNIYLGSILTCYLEYQPTNIKMDVILLLDTNFIISLLDLNTPESTHTCIKLLDVCKKLGYSFRILVDTIEEARNLLNFKANNFDNAIILKFVNKEDIYNACERRKLTKTDLDRIADNLENSIQENGIHIIPHSESLKNKAKFSNEYKILRKYRNSDKAALHDVEAILYVREKRGKRIKAFENVNCWFVNNSISHNIENEGIIPLLNPNHVDYQPEIIKVDDLLNILWLSSPSINTAIANDEIVDIGLTSLVAFTLNEALPKARIIKELDANIQKYKSESISDRDVFLLSVRIANGQFKNLEKLNEIAKNDPQGFNEGIKAEAEKQDRIEKERTDKFGEVLNKLYEEFNSLRKHKEKLEEEKEVELQGIKDDKDAIIIKKEREIIELKKKNLKLENDKRFKKREEYIKSKVKRWRNNSWIVSMICFIILLIGILWVINSITEQTEVTDSLFDKLLQNEIIASSISLILMIVNFFVIRALYDKYLNHSNINAFISKIIIPDDLQELPFE